jgi:hypothetical protein
MAENPGGENLEGFYGELRKVVALRKKITREVVALREK